MGKKSLSSLNWISRFLDETPGDGIIGGAPRQVPGVCWSRVNPTPMPNPALRLWSTEMAGELGVESGEDGLLGGNKIAKGMILMHNDTGATSLETGPVNLAMVGL